MATIFANNLLPILIAAGCGYLLGRYLDVDARALSRVVFYLFSPSLVFDLLTSTRLGGDEVVRMMTFAALNMALIALLIWMLGRLLRLERALLIALVLTVTFDNAGNFGLSLNQFAFGQQTLAHASLYFVTAAILMYSLGVVIASLGRAPLGDALRGLLRVPLLYGLLLALLVNTWNLTVPLPLQRTIALLGQAAIPAMLVLLGLQMHRVRWSAHRRMLALAVVLRLGGSVLLAWPLSRLLGLQGAALQAGLVEAAMPTAVMTTVLATEYDVLPEFVTAVVFATTVLSPLTLTPLIGVLQSL